MNFPDLRNLKPIPEQRMAIPTIPQLPPPNDDYWMRWEQYQREAIATAQSEAAHEQAIKEYRK